VVGVVGVVGVVIELLDDMGELGGRIASLAVGFVTKSGYRDFNRAQLVSCREESLMIILFICVKRSLLFPLPLHHQLFSHV
jgi:hypothetical protein